MAIARSMPRLIVFAGTVGSGKSTQMQLLADWLRRKGVKTRVIVLKTNHLLSNLLTLALLNILFVHEKNTFAIGTLIERRPVLLKKLLRLWLVLDCFSISLKFLWDIALPLKRGREVLVEEYLPAIIADYFYISKAVDTSPRVPIDTVKFVSTILCSAGPMDIIFLDAESEILQQRWRLRGTPVEKPAYIQMQRDMLLQCSKKLSNPGFLYVDTTAKTVNQTQATILTHLSIGVDERRKR